MRNKIPDDKKKDKTAVSIDENLHEIFNDYLEENDIPNKSKYIENLIRKDMEEKGKDVTLWTILGLIPGINIYSLIYF
jgi:metal-responsive CopG/Arc/MetJ family transcriptional regulator